MKLRQFLFLIFLISIWLEATYFSYQYFSQAQYQSFEDPTLISRILSYFQNPIKIIDLWNNLLFGQGLAGSSFLIRYSLVALAAFIILFFLQKLAIKYDYIKTRILYNSLPFLIFTVLWLLLGMTINGIAQAENLYWDSLHQIPGTFDAVTHIISGGMIFAFLQMFDWSEIFGFTRRTYDVILDQFTSLSIYMALAWYFEWMENLDPTRYSGGINDTIGDIFAGAIGGVIISLVYWVIYWLTFVRKNET